MRRLVAVTLMVAVVVSSLPDRSRAQSAADPSTGEQLFATSCGFCHQNGGRAAGRGPKLAGTERPDDYLLNRIRLGKEGAMPAYGRAFTDAQLRALVAYIRSLKDDGR
jgi:mono/diheme cytochrome c family protein